MFQLFSTIYRDPNPDPPAGDPPADPPADDKLILGKYKSQDDLIAAHKELETKLGQTTAKVKELEGKAAPKPVESGLTLDAPAAPSEIDIDDILKSSGLTPEEIGRQWAKDGKLTDEQYGRIKYEGRPVTRKTVDQYVRAAHDANESLNQKVAKATETVYGVVGGKDQWHNLIKNPAVAKVIQADREGIKSALENPDRAESTARWLVDTYNKDIGADKSRKIIVGRPASGGTSTGGGAGFGSDNEALTAQLEARRKHGGNNGDEWKDTEYTARYRNYITAKQGRN